MIGSRVRTYLNQDHTDESSFFKEDGGFHILLSFPDVMAIEVLENYCVAMIETVAASTFTTATEFDGVISDAFRTANLPLSFSIACLYRKNDLVFLKTYGQGAVVLQRNGRKVPLVKFGAFASGKIQEGDEIVLSFGEQDLFEDREGTVHIEFGLEEAAVPSKGVSPEWPEVEDVVDLPAVRQVRQGRRPSTNHIDVLNLIRARFAGKKGSPFLVAVLIVALLLIFYLRSYTSKTAQEDRLNLEIATSTITQKLEQAEDVFELNSGRSVALLTESKQDLKSLEKKLHSSHKNEIELLSSKIKAIEKKILQKNIKSSEEFIDLGLEEKGAQGTAMWRYEDRVIIVNPKGAVYILSLEKKSLEARSSPSIVGASLGGLDESTVYVYKKGAGIIKIESDTAKPKTAIKQDKDWGTITDLQVYNKNLYLLDSAKGQIYKYVPTEDGFATKSAYFKSGAYAQDAVSFAIDQSVYVAQKKLITKYTSGLQDGFAPTYPDSGPSASRVMTSNDVDDLYIWDKSGGRIVVLSKNGDYGKTIESSILSKATSVEVFADSAYALLGSKIFKVSLK